MLIVRTILGYFFIGVIGMVILAVCYLPIYFLLRKRIPLSRQIPCFLFGVCILVISSATFLYDIILKLKWGEGILSDTHALNLIPFQFLTEPWDMGMRNQITQNIANVLMFVPLGFIFPVAFRKMRTFGKTVLWMFGFSFTIEFIQYFIGRSADIDDLILNTLGGIIGYFFFYIFYKLCKNKKFGRFLFS